MAFIEKDEVRGLLKVNPLFDWSTKKLQEYLNIHQVPTNIFTCKRVHVYWLRALHPSH